MFIGRLLHDLSVPCAVASGLLWNLQMYVDGVCPDNQWHFPYKSAPSLLAIQAAVRHQLRVSEDPFSRLGSSRSTAASAPSAGNIAPKPISPYLYTAALLPKAALQDLEARERRTRGSPGAPRTGRLLKAKALLEAIANKGSKGVEGPPPVTQTDTRPLPTHQGTTDSNGEGPAITASKRNRRQPWNNKCPSCCCCCMRSHPSPRSALLRNMLPSSVYETALRRPPSLCLGLWVSCMSHKPCVKMYIYSWMHICTTSWV